MSLPSRFFCAPMAEISTPALRRVIREYSPGAVLYSEMLSAGAIVSRAGHNEPLIQKLPSDDPFIYQIAGSDPAVMAEAAAFLSKRGCYAVDINMGCSAPEILKTGAGARLLAEPARAREIVRRCRARVSCMLSVKLRSGFEANDEKRLADFALMLEDAGADFIVLHPRYAKLGFRQRADWRLVKLLKHTVRIPVLGSGDITDAATALDRMDETGCDGVMMGREAVKSPWIFFQCERRTLGVRDAVRIEVRDVFLKVLDHIDEYLPERLHKSRGHRFSFYFSKNVHFSHDLFTKIRRETSIRGMKHVVEEYYRRNPGEACKSIE